MITCCPDCGTTKIKKNGHIHNGKQNHYCKACGRQFVKNPQQKLISEEEKEQIRKLLLERIPLRGICRVMGVCSLFTELYPLHRLNSGSNSGGHCGVHSVWPLDNGLTGHWGVPVGQYCC